MVNLATPAAIRGRLNQDGEYRQRLEPREDKVANTITTVQKDNILILSNREFNRDISHCIEASYSKGVGFRAGKPRRQVVQHSARLRKLTPRECWRLMGFSDSDCNRAKTALNHRFYKGKDRSDSQLYKQAGNSIVVNVLLAIMQEMYKAMPYLFLNVVVGSFFSGIGAFEKALSRLQTK